MQKYIFWSLGSGLESHISDDRRHVHLASSLTSSSDGAAVDHMQATIVASIDARYNQVKYRILRGTGNVGEGQGLTAAVSRRFQGGIPNG